MCFYSDFNPVEWDVTVEMVLTHVISIRNVLSDYLIAWSKSQKLAIQRFGLWK